MNKGIVAYWPLLTELVRKELKVRYKRSILGFFWSLLNPLLMMAVFTILFTRIFPQLAVPLFPIFFLAGFLPWNFFAQALGSNVPAIVGNAGLIKKIYFPWELIPLATVGAHGIHFVLALALLLAALPFLGIHFLPLLPLLVWSCVLITMVCYGVSLLLTTVNVFYRDVQEFMPVLMMVWFYATPIIYDMANPRLIAHPLLRNLLWLNPMTSIVQLFRDCVYYAVWPSWTLIAFATAMAVAQVAVGLAVFRGFQWRFAEEV